MTPMRIPRRLPGNVPGRYYTTENCDGCAYCAAVAPTLFEYEKSTNTYHVARQPRARREIERMMDAMEDCPLDAIEAEPNGVHPYEDRTGPGGGSQKERVREGRALA